MMGFKASQKPQLLAILLALFLICALNLALAASGGVMGGSAFSSDDSEESSSSSSYSSHHSSYTDNTYYSGRESTSNDTPVGTDSRRGFGMPDFILIMGILVASGWLVFHSCQVDKKSLLMLQVGLSGEARSLQRDLNDVANTANTSTVKGFHYILTETILALLRHPTHCISGYSFVEQKQNMGRLEKHFNQLSLEEREKFDAETLVNVNNIKSRRRCTPKANKPGKEYIVVTILVAALGPHKLPVIKDSESLKEALQYLGSINTRKIKAVHVLWTPQNENDALFEEELLENYPLLTPI